MANEAKKQRSGSPSRANKRRKNRDSQNGHKSGRRSTSPQRRGPQRQPSPRENRDHATRLAGPGANESTSAPPPKTTPSFPPHFTFQLIPANLVGVNELIGATIAYIRIPPPPGTVALNPFAHVLTPFVLRPVVNAPNETRQTSVGDVPDRGSSSEINADDTLPHSSPSLEWPLPEPLSPVWRCSPSIKRSLDIASPTW